MTVGQLPHVVHFPGFFCYLPSNNLCIVGGLGHPSGTQWALSHSSATCAAFSSLLPKEEDALSRPRLSKKAIPFSSEETFSAAEDAHRIALRAVIFRNLYSRSTEFTYATDAPRFALLLAAIPIKRARHLH